MIRVGHGYDVHRLAEGRKLILGGVEIEYFKGLDGHSDADVLIHAICDALLGAAALGDIGTHFPPSEDKYRGIDSCILLDECRLLVAERGYNISNLDCVIVCQEPRLSIYMKQMRERISSVLSLEFDNINIKAKTEERLGFTGSGEGIAAHCVCLLYKN